MQYHSYLLIYALPFQAISEALLQLHLLGAIEKTDDPKVGDSIIQYTSLLLVITISD